MRFFKSLLPFNLINLVAMFCVTLTLPEIIPSHMNFKMEVDGYAGRWITMIFGGASVLISVGILVYWNLTKNIEKFQKNRKVEEIILPLIAALFIVISWAPIFMAKAAETLSAATTEHVFYFGLFFTMGLFMLIAGNFMGVIKHNRLLGIRTPWTLKDETVWKKTHRFGAYTSVIGGIIICVSAVLGFISKNAALSISGFIAGMILVAAVPMTYSYVIYKKLHAK